MAGWTWGPPYRSGLLGLLQVQDGIGGLLQLNRELLSVLLDSGQLPLHQVVLLRLLRSSHLSLLDVNRRDGGAWFAGSRA